MKENVRNFFLDLFINVFLDSIDKFRKKHPGLKIRILNTLPEKYDWTTNNYFHIDTKELKMLFCDKGINILGIENSEEIIKYLEGPKNHPLRNVVIILKPELTNLIEKKL